MKTYHALASLLIRFFAAFMVGATLLSFLYLGLEFIWFHKLPPGSQRWPASLLYLFIGFILFRWSAPLGKFLSKGLDSE